MGDCRFVQKPCIARKGGIVQPHVQQLCTIESVYYAYTLPDAPLPKKQFFKGGREHERGRDVWQIVLNMAVFNGGRLSNFLKMSVGLFILLI